MTVVPDDHLMTLICDTCGHTTTGTACVLPDAEVVWTLVSEHGWSGSPFATGPHRCPHCSPLPTDAHPARDGAPRTKDLTAAGLDIDYLDDVASAPGYVDPDAGDALRKALTAAVDLGGHVVVDLSEVRHIDSAGLGLLVRAHRDARARGAVLCLAAPSRLTVLHTMRLGQVFLIVTARMTPSPRRRSPRRTQHPPPTTRRKGSRSLRVALIAVGLVAVVLIALGLILKAVTWLLIIGLAALVPARITRLVQTRR